MSSVQKSIWQLARRGEKAIKLSSIKAQWHCTGDWSDISSSSSWPAMARGAHSSPSWSEHLTNCNQVSCRWHRENRFPYPSKRQDTSRFRLSNVAALTTTTFVVSRWSTSKIHFCTWPSVFICKQRRRSATKRKHSLWCPMNVSSTYSRHPALVASRATTVFWRNASDRSVDSSRCTSVPSRRSVSGSVPPSFAWRLLRCDLFEYPRHHVVSNGKIGTSYRSCRTQCRRGERILRWLIPVDWRCDRIGETCARSIRRLGSSGDVHRPMLRWTRIIYRLRVRSERRDGGARLHERPASADGRVLE